MRKPAATTTRTTGDRGHDGLRGEEAQQAADGDAAGAGTAVAAPATAAVGAAAGDADEEPEQPERPAGAGVVEALSDDLAYGHARLPVPGQTARSLVEAGERGKCDVEFAQPPFPEDRPLCRISAPCSCGPSPRCSRPPASRFGVRRRRRRPASARRAGLRLRQGHQADPRSQLRPLPRRDQAEERFRLDTRAGLLRGGEENEKVIVEGHSDQSPLIRLVAGPRRGHPDAAEEGGRDAAPHGRSACCARGSTRARSIPPA